MSVLPPSGGAPLNREVAKAYAASRNGERAERARGGRPEGSDAPGNHWLRRLGRKLLHR